MGRLRRYHVLLLPVCVGLVLFSHLFYARCSLPGPMRVDLGDGEIGTVIRYGSWDDGRLGVEAGWSPSWGRWRVVWDPLGSLGMFFVPSAVLLALGGGVAWQLRRRKA